MVVRRVSELGELSDAEKRVLAELDTGEVIVIGDGKVPEAGDDSRRVRAALIRLLLLGDDPEPKYRLHEKGLRGGAWIADRLDLEGCACLRDIGMFACRFAQAPQLRSAALRNLFLNRSHLPGLSADRLEAGGGVLLRDVVATGQVRLLHAKLRNDFDCTGARFRAENDPAGKPRDALAADWLEAGGVSLRGVEATGQVRLLHAKIEGDLECVGAKFRAEKDLKGDPTCAFAADGLVTGGGVILHNIEATGEVRLLGAKIGGDIACAMVPKFRAEKDSKGNPGQAFSADGLEAMGSIFLRGIDATGEVRLTGAKLGGHLECSGAFRAEKDAQGTPGRAFTADRLRAGGGVFLNGVDATGEVRLLGAKVDGDLSCIGSNFRSEKDGQGEQTRALCIAGTRVSGTFHLQGGTAVTGVLDLMVADLGNIVDDKRSWPAPGCLLLDRCRYGAFTGGPVDADSRLAWLGLQSPALWSKDFWPQPYEQLANVLREMGHAADARVVLIEKERLQRDAWRKHANLLWRPLLYVRDKLLYATADYGVRPLWAALWLVVFWLVGWGYFAYAEVNGAMKPNTALVLRSDEWVECTGTIEYPSQLACFLNHPRARSYPEFKPWIYSADTLLPIVDLEMQSFWIPDESIRAGRMARNYLWAHIAIGWALSLLAVAGFSGLVRSD